MFKISLNLTIIKEIYLASKLIKTKMSNSIGIVATKLGLTTRDSFNEFIPSKKKYSGSLSYEKYMLYHKANKIRHDKRNFKDGSHKMLKNFGA